MHARPQFREELNGSLVYDDLTVPKRKRSTLLFIDAVEGFQKFFANSVFCFSPPAAFLRVFNLNLKTIQITTH